MLLLVNYAIQLIEHNNLLTKIIEHILIVSLQKLSQFYLIQE